VRGPLPRSWCAAALFAGALLSGGCSSCGKKDETSGPPPPPPRGAASTDELTTSLGSARGLDEELAPTSTKWRRVFVLDDKRALLAGEVTTETVALFTDDAGKTWRSFRSERDAWSNWSAGLDGAVVLGLGARDGAPSAAQAQVAATRLRFASLDASSLMAPTPLFPTAKGPVEGLLTNETAIPALLGPGSAALVAEDPPKQPVVLYGGKPGADAASPLKLPKNEKIVPVPYGRPPVMLSIKGKDLYQRPFPAPGKPLDKPQKIPGIASTPTLLAELSAAPMCETGDMSFQIIKQNKRLQVIGVSPSKVVTFPLPDATLPATRLGCNGGHVVVEGVDAKTGPPALQAQQPDIPLLLRCDFDGKCSAPKNPAFRVWTEPHHREIVGVPIEAGVVGAMTSHANGRWGLYLAQGEGEASVFERPRPIGEGSGDRGRIELGALLSFGKRAVLLISADVTGTSRRGWFVMVSDDGGTTWGPP
jgi:hypothetical protein